MLTSTMPRNDAQSQLGTDSRRMSIPAAISTSPMFFAVRFPFLPPKSKICSMQSPPPQYRMRRARHLFKKPPVAGVQRRAHFAHSRLNEASACAII